MAETLSEPEHRPTPAVQVAYPGGKDGMWQAGCSCGKYRPSSYYSRAAGADRAAAEHARAKNNA